jgi:hypothetical protein
VPAVLALVLAPVAAGLGGIRLEGSPWRVPQSWSGLGPVGYATAFGAALGTGAVTALSSPAAYVLLAWLLTGPGPVAAAAVAAAYAAGRAAPLLGIAAVALRRDEHPAALVAAAGTVVPRLGPVEGAVLAAVAAAGLL